MSKNQFLAFFTLVGDFDPSAVTRQVGLEPSECWKKGEHGNSSDSVYEFSKWSLDSRLDMNRDIDDHVEDVLEQLNPRSHSLEPLLETHNGWIQIVVYLYSDSDSFSIGRQVITRCAALKLGLDFDYVYFGKGA